MSNGTVDDQAKRSRPMTVSHADIAWSPKSRDLLPPFRPPLEPTDARMHSHVDQQRPYASQTRPCNPNEHPAASTSVSGNCLLGGGDRNDSGSATSVPPLSTASRRPRSLTTGALERLQRVFNRATCTPASHDPARELRQRRARWTVTGRRRGGRVYRW